MARILISGSLGYDRIMDFPGYFKDHFLSDQLHNINVSFPIATASDNFGGTAGNIAYTLKLLGEEPDIHATVGSDFDRYRSRLDELGITTEHIQQVPTKLCSFATITTDRANNQITAFYAGASHEPYLRDIRHETAELAIVAAGSSADPLSFVRRYRYGKVPYFFDPAQQITALSADQLRDGITGAGIVFGNDYEFKLMAGKTGWQEADMLERAEALVVTLGENGSRVVTREGEWRVPAVPARAIVDPTGAGDAYRAGFAKGYLQGLPLPLCARLASAVAVHAVEKYGTQNHSFTIKELKERHKGAYGETLDL